MRLQISMPYILAIDATPVIPTLKVRGGKTYGTQDQNIIVHSAEDIIRVVKDDSLTKAKLVNAFVLASVHLSKTFFVLALSPVKRGNIQVRAIHVACCVTEYKTKSLFVPLRTLMICLHFLYALTKIYFACPFDLSNIFHVFNWFSASNNQKCIRLCAFLSVNVITLYSRRLPCLYNDVDNVAVHHWAISVYCCSNEVC